ncbi:MAG: type II secretion system protein [Phycisphaerae bacterium]
MKTQKNGFTMIEMLMVMGIIVILIGILIPSLTAVRRFAKNTQQTAQIVTLSLAIEAFKNEYGDYPASDFWNLSNNQRDYSGAQMLSEALLGWDLLGFHPKSEWRADGRYNDGADNFAHLYERATLGSYSDELRQRNLEERYKPYIDRSQIQVARVGQLFNNTQNLAAQTFVICDVFNYRKITGPGGSMVWAGAPILYYKARTNHYDFDSSELSTSRYDWRDNGTLIRAKGVQDGVLAGTAEKEHEWFDRAKFYGEAADYNYSLRDPLTSVPNRPWPYRPDSYILISAGADGEYGTSDDITNFR